MTRGRFIVFEGGEGCGKSTQVKLLAERLNAVQTREPGGTGIGTQIRALLLGRDTTGLHERAEALLMAADRAQHVAELIEPILAAGRHVVCDRYMASSIAYQGFGRGLAPTEIRDLSLWAAAGLQPDLVVFLAVSAEESQIRRGGARDRIEDAGAEFHQRVADGFMQQANDDPERWAIVNGEDSIEQVHSAVLDIVNERLGLLK